MKRIEITGARLALPRLLNDVELAPESAAPEVNFDLGSAILQKNDGATGGATIALSLSLAGKNETFARLVLSLRSTKALAEKLLELSASSALARTDPPLLARTDPGILN